MNSEISKEKNKPRNPKLAFLLALIGPGFGQIYNGQIKKGMLFLFIELFLPVLYGLTKLGVFFVGFVLILIISFSYRIYLIYDATTNAKKLKDFAPKPYNKWYYFLGIIIGVYTILWYYDANSIIGIKSFKIPTTANEPALKVGDNVVADLNAFDNVKPNYGDIVIFQKKDSLYPWIYRIVGLPNDKIEIQNNFLIINGKKCKTSFIKETKSEEFDVKEYEEELPNGHKHKIYTLKKPFEDDENAEHDIIIPRDGYYLMGDNRDNAMDSRYIGVIKEDEIKGKVVFSYWGKTNDRINIDFRNK
ncbi:signal peptidase I [Flavobacterium zhairuonense]|uniref:signal peptidase I n=1 Tax=Flavobacterium zhairuonense TaxID=2493631 RepID=UPI001051AEAA|nr:signal peptidase I [Flavobacterium zhairuonense]KAF2514737.1 signal peptidase I [Flavobacterium zhairuonense]